MGKTDRIIRGLLGLVVIGLGISFQSFLGIIGGVLVITAIVARCPMYYPFKINTGKKPK